MENREIETYAILSISDLSKFLIELDGSLKSDREIIETILNLFRKPPADKTLTYQDYRATLQLFADYEEKQRYLITSLFRDHDDRRTIAETCIALIKDAFRSWFLIENARLEKTGFSRVLSEDNLAKMLAGLYIGLVDHALEVYKGKISDTDHLLVDTILFQKLNEVVSASTTVSSKIAARFREIEVGIYKNKAIGYISEKNDKEGLLKASKDPIFSHKYADLARKFDTYDAEVQKKILEITLMEGQRLSKFIPANVAFKALLTAAHKDKLESQINNLLGIALKGILTVKSSEEDLDYEREVASHPWIKDGSFVEHFKINEYSKKIAHQLLMIKFNPLLYMKHLQGIFERYLLVLREYKDKELSKAVLGTHVADWSDFLNPFSEGYLCGAATESSYLFEKQASALQIMMCLFDNLKHGVYCADTRSILNSACPSELLEQIRELEEILLSIKADTQIDYVFHPEISLYLDYKKDLELDDEEFAHVFREQVGFYLGDEVPELAQSRLNAICRVSERIIDSYDFRSIQDIRVCLYSYNLRELKGQVNAVLMGHASFFVNKVKLENPGIFALITKRTGPSNDERFLENLSKIFS